MRRQKNNSIRVYLVNPRGGADLRRLSMALNLIFSEEDVLKFMRDLRKKAEDSCPINLQGEVSAKSP